MPGLHPPGGAGCGGRQASRTYGPTMLLSDTKAISQFLKKGAAGEDIVLKSVGDQFYSYSYVADAVSGLLTVLLKGDCGEAYNVADPASDITLKDLAQMIAGKAGTKVAFALPDEKEAGRLFQSHPCGDGREQAKGPGLGGPLGYGGGGGEDSAVFTGRDGQMNG